MNKIAEEAFEDWYTQADIIQHYLRQPDITSNTLKDLSRASFHFGRMIAFSQIKNLVDKLK